MAKKFFSISLRNKLILLFAGAMFISMLLFGTIMFINVYNNTRESLSKNVETTVATVSQSIDQSFLLAENLAVELSGSEGIQKWLDDGNYYDRNSTDYYLKKSEFSKEMNRILIYSNAKKLDVVAYVSVFIGDEMLEYSDLQSVGEAMIRRGSEASFAQAEEYEGQFIYSQLVKEPQNVIFHVRKMRSYFDGPDPLAILVATKERDVYKVYEELVRSEGSAAYLVDSKNRIFSSNREDQIGEYIAPELEAAVEQGKHEVKLDQDYLMESKYLGDSEMRMVYLYPKHLLTVQAMESVLPYVLLSAVLIVLCLFAAVALGLRSTKFLNEFVWAMRNVKEKRYDVKIRKYKDPEIDRLGEAFNEMTAEIKELIQNKYESQLLLNEMEIRFLQHQMNPHFLFNVLLTIQIKAKRCSDESIYRMVSTLSALLRASIYTTNVEHVTVREELEYAEFYLYLQKMRFEDKISYEIDIADEGLNECVIPKFVIEPIVENAVIHGIEDAEGPGHIVISVKKEKGCLIADVKDNGVGFDVERYRKMMEDRGDEEETEIRDGSSREKIGLRNVDLRIKHIYGKKYGVKISSEINKGTVVRIVIPAEEDKNV